MLAIAYEVFFEVASHLSFSKAAEALYISQPAVSKQVKKLESELGIALFERQGNTIKLTSSGENLLNYLRKAKIIQKQIQSDIEIIMNQQTAKGELKIGASTTISLYVMPKVLSSFRRKFPDVKLLLINRNSENILKALLDQEIDIAIIEAHYKINAVHFQPFMNDEIIPVCSRHSPYGKSDITLKNLRDLPISLRERGSGTHAVLKKNLEDHKLKMGDLNITARLGGTEALKNYLVEDNSIGFLSRLAVEKELQSGSLQEVRIKSLKINRKFEFVMRKGEEIAGITREFIKEAKSVYN
ncbi:MAG: LysR substrate-binding domain-containing protein [Cyclobacteriaceae bacterium]